jgi:hypothetical protein
VSLHGVSISLRSSCGVGLPIFGVWNYPTLLPFRRPWILDYDFHSRHFIVFANHLPFSRFLIRTTTAAKLRPKIRNTFTLKLSTPIRIPIKAGTFKTPEKKSIALQAIVL